MEKIPLELYIHTLGGVGLVAEEGSKDCMVVRELIGENISRRKHTTHRTVVLCLFCLANCGQKSSCFCVVTGLVLWLLWSLKICF